MWANTVWGLFCFALTFALFGITAMWTPGHENTAPMFFALAVVCLLAGLTTLAWPIVHSYLLSHSAANKKIILGVRHQTATISASDLFRDSFRKRPTLLVNIATISFAAVIGVIVIRVDDYISGRKDYAEVRLLLVDKKSPSLVLTNPSGATAEDVIWHAILWNVDSLGNKSSLPLPPNTKIDFMKPTINRPVPFYFMGDAVRSTFHEGDRIVGSISSECKNCKIGHTIIVSIVWGRDGWYDEMTGLRRPPALSSGWV